MNFFLPLQIPCSLLGLLFMVGPLMANPLQQTEISYLGEERSEKLDVWLPPDSVQRPVPAVLLIHGGGWAVGDKAAPRERSIAKDLNEMGYAVFSVNYLLEKKTTTPQGESKVQLAWPQNFADCKSALRFMRREARRFGVDPRRIAVMGGSAGGHLAMLTGFTSQSPEMNSLGLYSDERTEVACVVSLYGIHDVRQFEPHHFVGSTDEETEHNLAAASPMSYLSRNTPPVLVIHGTADKIVSVNLSREFTTRLAALGIPYQYVEVQGAGHSFDLQPEQKDLRPIVKAFLHKHLD